MTRIQSTTNLIGQREQSVRLDDPFHSADALAGLGAGAQALGRSLSRIGVAIESGRKQREALEQRQVISRTLFDAELQGANLPAGEAFALFRSAHDKLEGGIENIADADVAEAADEYLKNYGTLVRNRVLTAGAEKETALTLQAVQDEATALLDEIAEGNMDYSLASQEFVASLGRFGPANLTDQDGEYTIQPLSDAQRNKMIDGFIRAAVGKEYHYWLPRDPRAAVQIMESEAARNMLDPDDRRRKIDFATNRFDEFDRAQAQQQFGELRNVVDHLLSRDDFDIDNVRSVLAAGAKALSQQPGAVVTGEFGEKKNISEDALTALLVTRHFDAAVAESSLRPEAALRAQAIAELMPQTPEARKHIADGLDTIAREAKARQKTVEAKDVLMQAFLQGVTGPDAAQLPNEEAPLAAFFDETQKLPFQVPLEAVADWFTRNKFKLPINFIDAIQNNFRTDQLGDNFGRGLAPLKIIARDNWNQALGIALDAPNGQLAADALEITRNVPIESPLAQDVIESFSNPLAPGLVERARLHRMATEAQAKREGIKRILPGEAMHKWLDLARPGVFSTGKPFLSAHFLHQFDAQLDRAWVDMATVENITDESQLAQQAPVRAAQRVAQDYVDVRVDGTTWLVPAMVGVGTVGRKNDLHFKLQQGLDGLVDMLGRGGLSEHGTIRPDLPQVIGDKAYFPALYDGGADTWFEFNTVNGAGRPVSTIYEEDRPLVDTLNSMLKRSGRQAGELTFDAHVMYDPATGATSVYQYDELTGAIGTPNSMEAQLRRLAGEQWKLTHRGLPPDLTDPDQQAEYGVVLDLIRQAAKWPAWGGPESSGGVPGIPQQLSAEASP